MKMDIEFVVECLSCRDCVAYDKVMDPDHSERHFWCRRSKRDIGGTEVIIKVDDEKLTGGYTPYHEEIPIPDWCKLVELKDYWSYITHKKEYEKNMEKMKLELKALRKAAPRLEDVK